ncbi:hypothetical protein [Aquincola tertiaricarbonis]|uniref:hypothetical protein n=1 Tax=Aquincola tertiaricarbonis TaxID=391953 RepID=UPI000614EFF4|nr:hypothetical protein [Aquincola tertiaricarbonis]
MKKAAVEESVIRDDGLRYKAKPAGSRFPGATGLTTGTMSCFRCGVHRPIADLEFKPVLGIKRRVCRAGCRKTG